MTGPIDGVVVERRRSEGEYVNVDSVSGTFRVQLVMANPLNKIPAGLRCSARLIK